MLLVLFVAGALAGSLAVIVRQAVLARREAAAAEELIRASEARTAIWRGMSEALHGR